MTWYSQLPSSALTGTTSIKNALKSRVERKNLIILATSSMNINALMRDFLSKKPRFQFALIVRVEIKVFTQNTPKVSRWDTADKISTD